VTDHYSLDALSVTSSSRMCFCYKKFLRQSSLQHEKMQFSVIMMNI